MDSKQYERIGEIDDKYVLVKKLGKGATSTVYLGYDKTVSNNEKELFAFKSLKIKTSTSNSIDQDIYTSFRNEVNILSTLSALLKEKFTYYQESSSNAKLTKLNGKEREIAYIKIQYLPNGELFDYIFYPKKGLGENFSRLVFKSILDEVKTIHDINYVHRDLKTENIMIDSNFNVKLCDFGFATNNRNDITTFCGTNGYISPELLNKQPYNGVANDIFSLGVILFVLVTGTMPFRAATIKDQFYNLIWKRNYDQFWKLCQCKVSENFKQMLNGMLCQCPEERLTISEIMSSAWMNEGDYGEENYKVLKEELMKRKRSIKKRKTNLI